MSDITKTIVELVVTLAVLAVSYFLLPWLKTKLGAEKYEKMMAFIRDAVAAAEQIFTGIGRGDDKLRFVKAYLKENGYGDIDETLIESAVYNIINAYKDTTEIIDTAEFVDLGDDESVTSHEV